MVRYTNKYNLDRTVVEFLKNDDYDYNYDPNVISATSLIAPTLQVAYKRLYHDDLEVDVSDLIASSYGTAIHSAFENIKLTDCVQEQRLMADFGDFRVSGKFDILRKEVDGYRLIDIKSTSVWKLIMDDFEDYIKQLSIYRYLGRKNGYDILDKAYIFFLFTDWSSSKAKEDPNYPQLRFQKLELQLWNLDDTEKYIKERFYKIKEAEELIKAGKDIEVEVTRKELWQKDDTFAVMKAGRKSAVRLYDNKLKAQMHIDTDADKDKLSIEQRNSVARRCSYCNCTKFCKLYKILKSEGRVE